MKYVKRLGWLLAAALLAALPAKAQTPVRPPAPAAPAAQQPAGLNQPLSIVAGTGVLLHLAQPAATVLSADPSIARAQPASPTSLFLMGVAPGRTTVIATNQSGAAIVQYDITVTPAAGHAAAGPLPGPALAPALGAAAGEAGVSAATAAAVQATIARTVQGAQQVSVRAAGKDLLLTGVMPNAFAAQQAEAIARAYVGEKAGVIDSLTVLGNIQVNVRVRIAEINRQVTRQLGFNWQALGAGGTWQFGMLTGAATGLIAPQAAFGNFAPPFTRTPGLNSPPFTPSPFSATSPMNSLGLTPLAGTNTAPYQLGAGYATSTRDINGIIDALAADQLITILAEPNLTAQSGETASFLAGGEFPIPVAGNSNNGGTTITVEFKQFGVSLAIVPTVLSPTQLNLRIRPEVSQLSTNGAVNVPLAGGTLTIPALTVRRAETTVELGSGQSFAIAGLLQRTSTNVTNALPGIGELPVVGALFKSNDFQRGESELVIIVTPYIVQPVASPQALRLPTDGFRPATDLDRILFGRQVAPGARAPGVNAGFILK